MHKGHWGLLGSKPKRMLGDIIKAPNVLLGQEHVSKRTLGMARVPSRLLGDIKAMPKKLKFPIGED